MRFLRWLFSPSIDMPACVKIGDWAMDNPYHGERRPIAGFGYREWDGACAWWRIFSEAGKEIGIVCPEWEKRRSDPAYAEIYAAMQRWSAGR